MRYLLIALCILAAFPSLADKKKKAGQKAKSSISAGSSKDDVIEYTSTAVMAKENQAGLPATRVGAPLIHFILKEWNGKEYNRDMVGKGPLILMLYNPGCDHCLELCKKLLENRVMLKDVELLLISGVDTKPAVKDFMSSAGITENDTMIHVTLGEREITDQLFEAKGIPQLMIYNADKILQKVFYSEADMAEVSALLKR